MTCLRAVTPQLAGGSSADVTPVEVIKYKDIIRDQDAEMTQLRERLAGMQKEVEELKASKEQMSSQVQQLHDENTGEGEVWQWKYACLKSIILSIDFVFLIDFSVFMVIKYLSKSCENKPLYQCLECSKA